MKPFTFTVNGETVDLPTVSVPVGTGMRRDAVSQLQLIAAIAHHMNFDLDTEESATAAWEAEETLAQEHRLTPTVFLRPPAVSIAQSGTYRYVPIELDPEALNEAAEAIVSRLDTREGREEWDAYIHILDNVPYAPVLSISPAFLADTARSICEQWHIPTSAAGEVEQAMVQALVKAGMTYNESDRQLRITLPFKPEDGIARMQEEYLDTLGDNEIDLWKLVEAYVGGSYGISLRWRTMLEHNTKHEDTPAWPLHDTVHGLLYLKHYEIQTLDSYKSAWLQPDSEDIDNTLDTAGGVFTDNPREAWAHYIRYGRVMVKPFEFPNVEDIVEDIAALLQPTNRNSGEHIVSEKDLCQRLSERYGEPITSRDIRRNATRAGSNVLRAFRRSRLKPIGDDFYITENNDSKYVYGYAQTAYHEPFNGRNHRSQMGDHSASVIPVHVSHLLAGPSNQVYMMTVLGPREAVSAAFARLFSGSSRKKYATSFSVGTYSSLYPLDRIMYDHMRQRIPDTQNQLAMTLLAHQAIPDKFDPSQDHFLLLAEEDKLNVVPPHFLGMLDRAIMLPLLPSWADYLWWEGIDRELITPVPKQIGTTAGWIVGTETHLSELYDRTWQNIIRDGLKDGAISIRDEADIRGDDVESEHVAMNITSNEIEEAIMRLSLEAAGVMADGD